MKLTNDYFYYQTGTISMGFILGWDWLWILAPTFIFAAKYVLAGILLIWIYLRKMTFKM